MGDIANPESRVIVKEVKNSDPNQPVEGIRVKMEKPSSLLLKGAPTKEEADILNKLARAREARLKYNQEHPEEQQTP